MGGKSRLPGCSIGGLEVNHRDQAERLVSEVHDPGQAALIHAVLALADAFETLAPPEEPEPGPPVGQTAETWRWD